VNVAKISINYIQAIMQNDAAVAYFKVLLHY